MTSAKRRRRAELLLASALLAGLLVDGCRSKEQAPAPLPSCAFREPRCIPPPRRTPPSETSEWFDADAGFDPEYVLPSGLFVGLHRWGQSDQSPGPCPLQLAWNFCRDWRWGDIHYDDQLYIVKIRIHREGRGGKPFAPDVSLRRISTLGRQVRPMGPLIDLGMAEHELVQNRPKYEAIRFARDPEFGALKIYSYGQLEVEVDLDSGAIIGAFVLL